MLFLVLGQRNWDVHPPTHAPHHPFFLPTKSHLFELKLSYLNFILPKLPAMPLAYNARQPEMLSCVL